jgi:hypothetical protein
VRVFVSLAGGPHSFPQLGTIGPPAPALSQTGKPAPVASAAALRRVFLQGPAGTEQKRFHVGLKRIECGWIGEGISPCFVVRRNDHQDAGIVVPSDGDAFVGLAKRPVHCCKDLSAGARQYYMPSNQGWRRLRYAARRRGGNTRTRPLPALVDRRCGSPRVRAPAFRAS